MLNRTEIKKKMCELMKSLGVVDSLVYYYADSLNEKISNVDNYITERYLEVKMAGDNIVCTIAPNGYNLDLHDSILSVILHEWDDLCDQKECDQHSYPYPFPDSFNEKTCGLLCEIIVNDSLNKREQKCVNVGITLTKLVETYERVYEKSISPCYFFKKTLGHSTYNNILMVASVISVQIIKHNHNLLNDFGEVYKRVIADERITNIEKEAWDKVYKDLSEVI